MIPTNASSSHCPLSCEVPEALAVIRDAFALNTSDLAQYLSERTKTRAVPTAAELQARHGGAILSESHYRRNIRMASLDARLLARGNFSLNGGTRDE